MRPPNRDIRKEVCFSPPPRADSLTSEEKLPKTVWGMRSYLQECLMPPPDERPPHREILPSPGRAPSICPSARMGG